MKRLNRFLAHVLLQGKEEIIHVKNTGRCKKLLVKGAKVILEKSESEKRKTKYSLISVYKDNRFINLDSQAPNQAAEEVLLSEKIKEMKKFLFCGGKFFIVNPTLIFMMKKGEKRIFGSKRGKFGTGGDCLFSRCCCKQGERHVQELI